MPPEWTGALLTFAMSDDGATFHDLVGFDGHEVAINVVPGTAVIVPPAIARAIPFLKLRSGTKDQPVPQEADRQFTVTTV